MSDPATEDFDAGVTFFGAERSTPYPAYAEIRRHGLARSSLGGWFAADYATCLAVVRDPRFVRDARRIPGFEPPAPTYFAPGRPVPTEQHDLLGVDGPDHTRLRRLVSKVFSPRAIGRLEPFTVGAAATLIDDLRERAGRADLMETFAFPLPLIVICKILGVPVKDRDQLRAWGDALVPLLDPVTSPERKAAAHTANVELCRYFDALISDRRRHRGDDLLSELIEAEESGDRLSTDELLGTSLLLLGAGFETTVNLIGNGTLALVRNPDQLAVLRADPSLIPGGVEELLRYDAPVQMTGRMTTDPVQLAGQHLDAFDQMLLVLGGANRDPAKFPNPDVLDVRRSNAAEHLSFSSGAHFCLGAALARMEGRVAFAALLGAFSNIELIEPPEWRDLMVLHGLRSLSLSLSSG